MLLKVFLRFKWVGRVILEEVLISICKSGSQDGQKILKRRYREARKREEALENREIESVKIKLRDKFRQKLMRLLKNLKVFKG